jgi:hypothetical protein
VDTADTVVGFEYTGRVSGDIFVRDIRLWWCLKVRNVEFGVTKKMTQK